MSYVSFEVFGVSRADANQLIDEVQQMIRRRWRAVVDARDVQRIADCFDPSSFEADPPEIAAL